MRCPHCLESFHASWDQNDLTWGNSPLKDKDGVWRLTDTLCPACNRAIIRPC